MPGCGSAAPCRSPCRVAETLTMPLASMSKVTSICGMPRGAGGMPTRSNCAQRACCLPPARARPGKRECRPPAGCPPPWRMSGCLPRRDRRVALDQLGHHAAERLDAERQRRHVEQQNVLHVALQDAGLDRGADGDHLVRVHALVRLLAEEVLAPSRCTFGMRVWPPTSTTSSMSFGVEAGILQRRLAGLDRPLDQVGDQLLRAWRGSA